MLVIGKKLGQTQKFLENGMRIPVTIVATPGNTVLMHKKADTDGYWAMQLGLGERKNANKPQMGHAMKAHLDKAPRFVKEARLTEKEAANMPEVGSVVDVATVLEPGALVDVTGMSKGKGFAGGVKRYQFRGGPKTHGQSDRHRAPGSIGSGTTPGRVYKGKRMAGKMGNDTTTLKNLEVVAVGDGFVWIKGVVPGIIGAVVYIKPTGKKNKRFVAVIKSDVQKAQETAAEVKPEVVEVQPEVKEEVQTEVKEEAQEAQAPVEEIKAEAPVEEAKEEVQTPAEEAKEESSVQRVQDEKEEAK